jgi:hypothetical protein
VEAWVVGNEILIVLQNFVKKYESDRDGRKGMTVVVFLRTRKIGTAGCVEFGGVHLHP